MHTVTKLQQAPLQFIGTPSVSIGSSAPILATGGSTNAPITFSTGTWWSCRVEGTNVIGLNANWCTITANKAGNEIYEDAAPIQQTIFVAMLNQQITSFGVTPNPLVVGSNGSLSAQGGGSGKPITFASATQSVCTVSGASVSGVAPGTCKVVANQEGDYTYNPAPQVEFTFNVNPKQTQSSFAVGVGNANLLVGGTTQLSTSGGSGTGGVSYSSNSGSCTISGTTLTAASEGSCTITATRAGDPNYLPASATVGVSVSKASQAPLTVSASATILTVGGTTMLSTSGGSGTGAVTYASSNTSVCTVSATTVTAGIAGSCTITATKAGDANYLAASSSIGVIVNPPPVSVWISQSSSTTSSGAPYQVSWGSANATSCIVDWRPSGGGFMTFSTAFADTANLATVVVGVYDLRITCQGYGGPATQTIAHTVNKLNQQITSFAASPSSLVEGASGSLSAQGGASGKTVTFTSVNNSICTVSGSTVTAVAPGTCNVLANQEGDSIYHASPQVSLNISVAAKQNQVPLSLSVGNSSLTVGGTTMLSMSGGSGTGAVTYASSNASVCTVSATTVTAGIAGTCTITATKAGDANYLAASTSIGVTVNKAAQAQFALSAVATTLAPGGTTTLSTSGGSGTGAVTYSSNSGSCTLSSNMLTASAAGSCTITATKAGDANYLAATSSLGITVNNPLPVTASVSQTLATTLAGGEYDVTWSSTNATSCLLDFSRSGEIFIPFYTTLSGTHRLYTSFIGPVRIRLTCQGFQGPAVQEIVHQVNPIGAPPTVTLSAPPVLGTNPSGTANVPIRVRGADTDGNIASFDLYVDSTNTGDFQYVASKFNLTKSVEVADFVHAAGVGTHRYWVYARDNTGNYVRSDLITVTVVAANILGEVRGVRSTIDNGIGLEGWVCQKDSPAAVAYQVWANNPAAGGTWLGAGVANVSGEVDNAAVQAACNTPGTPHHLWFDLSSWTTSNLVGAPIYVRAQIGSQLVDLPCTGSRCLMPGTTRLGLTTPVEGDRFAAPATIFMRTRITGSTGPYDAVTLHIDGGDGIAGVVDGDVANNAYYAFTDTPLAARTAPYAVVARVTKNGVTVQSMVSQIYVDAANGLTLALTSPSTGAIVSASTPVNLSATLGGTVIAGTSVRFYVNGTLVPGAAPSGANWNLSWTPPVAGQYSIIARALDGSNRIVGQSSVAKLTVIAASGAPAAPIPVVVSVPHAGNAMAGTLPGALGVSKSGAANYAIDIVVPPGTAGLAPSLSLSYNSQGTNGIAGLGWSLNGLSSIHRCGKTIAQDGVNERITFAKTDRLCLDGQRLVLTNLSLTDDNYWADGAQYRTEIDAFARITAQGSGLAARSFLVESKDGRKTTYGLEGTTSVQRAVVGFINSSSNCAANASSCTPTAKSGPLAWGVYQITDRANNYIRFDYQQDLTTGEFLPKSIRYGASGGQTAASNAHAAVQFFYESRPDGWKRYVDEARNDQRMRLQRVTTYVGDNLGTDLSSATKVRDLTLTYVDSQSSGRSLLSTVQVCAPNPQTSANDCLPATRFDWGNPQGLPTLVKRTDEIANAPVLTTHLTPSAWTSHGLTGSQTAKMHSNFFAFADFNQDGRVDILEMRVSSPSQIPAISETNADQLTREANPILAGAKRLDYRYLHNTSAAGSPAAFVEYRYKIDRGANEPFVVLATGDFNGDGSPDLVVSTSTGAYVCVSPLARTNSPSVAPGGMIVFPCGAALTGTKTPGAAVEAIPLNNEIDGIPYVSDYLGEGRPVIFSKWMKSLATNGGAWRCAVTSQTQPELGPAIPSFTCTVDTAASGGALGAVYDRFDEAGHSGYFHPTAFTQMVDFAGTGKASAADWSRVLLRPEMVDGAATGNRIWTGWHQSVKVTDRPTELEIAGRFKPFEFTHTNPSTVPANYNGAKLPYRFMATYPLASTSGDLNGSGYSSLAFTHQHYNLSDAATNRAELLLCLSTGRSLDCAPRSAYSWVQTGQASPPQDQVPVVRGVGSFAGDGATSLLVENTRLVDGNVTPYILHNAGSLSICSAVSDVQTSGAAGVDSKLPCTPLAGGFTMPTPRLTQGSPDTVFVLDVLGTGRPQLVVYNQGGFASGGVWVEDGRWTLYEIVDRAAPGQALDRIHQVTNGLGHVSSVEYAEGRASGVVQQTGTNTLSYPLQAATGVGKIVKKLSVATGTGHTRSTTYQYFDPATDVSGRGSLGFAKVVATDDQTSVQSIVTYAQAYPHTGSVLTSVSRVNGIDLTSTTNTLGVRTFTHVGGQTRFPHVANSITVRRDLNGAPLGSEATAGVNAVDADVPDVQYDDYGNVIGSRVTLTGPADDGGFTQTTRTTNTYPINEGSWLVGLLSNTKVSKAQSDSGTVVREKSFGYDGEGRLITDITEPNGGSELKLTTSITYNTFGLPETKTTSWFNFFKGQAESAAETLGYDSKGRYPTTQTNALGHSETRAYNNPRTGALTSLTGPNGLTTGWEHDGFGRITKETRADGTYTTTARLKCDSGCPGYATQVEITDTFAGTSRTQVPSMSYTSSTGQSISSQTWGFDGRRVIVSRSYDNQGRLQSETHPAYQGDNVYNARTLTYDTLGRVETTVTEDTPNGLLTSRTVYNGFEQTHTNPKSQIRKDNRDVLGRLRTVITVIDANGKTTTTTFKHDSWNNLVETIDPNGNVIKVSYDVLGRKTQLMDPNLGQIDYYVDARGLSWQQFTPKHPKTASTPAIKSDYDKLGRLTRREEPDLKSGWDYDTATKGIGQLAEAYTYTGSVSATAAVPEGSRDYRRWHTYDGLGRPSLTTQQLADASYTQLTEYDGFGRPITHTYRRGTDTPKVFQPRYNGFGYLYQWQRSDMVLSKIEAQRATGAAIQILYGNGLKETRNTDPRAERLESADLNTALGAKRLNNTYTFDKLGNITNRTTAWDTVTTAELLTYDVLNRLKTSTIGGAQKVYDYDDVGNITLKDGRTYTYPAQGPNSVRPNAVSSVSTLGNYTYDANGNLETAPNRSGTWTSFDMPKTLVKGSGSSERSAEFIYGPEHQRTRQIKREGGSIVSTTVYAGPQEVENKGGAITVKTYWPAGLGVEIDRPATGGQAASSEWSWQHVDRLGSINLLTGVDGSVRERMAFDVWGKRRTLDGLPMDGITSTPDSLDGQIDNRGFTGHEMLDALDLVHMNGRVYDPQLARFISADPILQDPMNGQSYNRYAYVMNNPTNLTDPSGFSAEGIDGTKCWIASRLSSCGGSDGGSDSGGQEQQKPEQAKKEPQSKSNQKTDGQGNNKTDSKLPNGQTPEKGALAGGLEWITELIGVKDLSVGINKLGEGLSNLRNFSIASLWGDSGGATLQLDMAQSNLTSGATEATLGAAMLGANVSGGIAAGKLGMGLFRGEAASSVWALSPFERGRAIENMLGANTGWNFPTIDRFANGVATSIKSIDLNAKTYQSTSNLTSALNKHINALSKFAGADWAKVTVPGNAAKELQLAIPHGGNQAQQAAIQAAAQRAQAQGIKLTTTIIP